MNIKETQQAIVFYENAIENAKAHVEFKIKGCLKYQEFNKKWYRVGSACFLPGKMNFEFYHIIDCEINDYFEIKNGEIFYLENSADIENIEEIAQELLSIVGKFYE